MALIDLGVIPALSALAVEEALLERLDGGGEGVGWLFWTPEHLCAVLGTARPAGADLLVEEVRAAGLPVLRRRSGGGTVLLGPAGPAVTRIAPPGGGVRECYAGFCEVLGGALDRLGLESEFHPPADLAVSGRKVAGLAQRRKRRAALVTASVLCAPLAAEAERFLALPAAGDAPEYRAGRPHSGFMTSLRELGVKRPARALLGALKAELAERGRSAEGCAVDSGIRVRAAEIEAELADPEWVWRL